ncbi:hypothetical protein [Lentilactobacillus kribbianus]|uniref:hypothetical protein n=1 Tax=Lentilactobacillus kribbianus TaxID=2729622 RepID=UPI001556BBC7|nr:hypothetical protein [Lentilactobacillus kribbianus]
MKTQTNVRGEKMQNQKSNLANITQFAQQQYQKLFSPINNIEFKQMPLFQIELFLQQTIHDQLIVQLDFKDQSNPIIGQIFKLNQERYLITTQNKKINKLLFINEIKAIHQI